MADTSLLCFRENHREPAIHTVPHHTYASRDMLPHVEMPARVAAACTGAAGIKLFGKVITTTQPPPPPPPSPMQAHHGGGGGGGSAPPRLQNQATTPGRASADLLEEAARARAAAAEARLPCPRCRSRDTKFCYFNNYNVNQPRHFCRACHRYWTAGGAIRNVPVGSGRRKNRPVLPPMPMSMPVPPPHAAGTNTTADHVSSSGPGSPPVFASAGLAVPYRGTPFHHLAPPPSPACTAAISGLPEAATGQYWWLVAGGAVASDRAF